MFFIVLTFFAALFIEGLGSLVSVIGISALFGANPIIISLAVALDVGKIVVVSLLYTYWKELSKLMKAYALAAATVTMIITSAGAAGYLTGEFQKSIMATKEGDLKVAVLKEQQAKYELRKKQIDDQVAALPTKTTVNQRLRLMRGFQTEQKALDAKIAEIDKSLPALQVAQIGTEAKAGPIVSISKAFKIPMEEAVSWVIAMIIFVFDPLAIFLIIAGNFLWARRKAEMKAKEEVKVEVFNEPQPEGFQQFKSVVGTHGHSFPAGPELPATGHAGAVFFHTGMGQIFIHDGTEWSQANSLSSVKEPVETEYEKYEAPLVLPTQEAIDSATIQVPPGLSREELREFIVSHAEPEPIKEPEPVVEEPPVEEVPEPPVEPDPVPPVEDPEPNRSTYVQTGLLKPVEVFHEVSSEHNNSDNFIEMTVEPIPIHREEITRSTLGLVDADPSTIVDAQRRQGFRRAEAVSTAPK